MVYLGKALESGWSRGWLSRPSLDPPQLLTRARKISGSTDAGGEGSWRTRLDILCQALAEQARLTSLGRTIAHGQLVAALANRLRAHELWRQHPEILEVPIRAPIIIVGQMRSGSTRVQRLLACDPRLTYTRFFESWNPIPRYLQFGFIDDRRARAWLALQSARFLSPEFEAIHPTGVSEPDEEIGFHSVSIFGSAFEAQWRVPAFTAHNEVTDTHPIYQEFKRLLQTVAWLRRETPGRAWVLKVPQMAQDLSAALRVFPDAKLIFLHRAASDIVGSSASLVYHQMRGQSDQVDRRWIGAEWLRKVALRHDRIATARASSDRPQVDVDYASMTADWQVEMQRIYDMLGLELTDEVQALMTRYQTDRRHEKLARHKYSLADFGLSQTQIGKMFDPCRLALGNVG